MVAVAPASAITAVELTVGGDVLGPDVLTALGGVRIAERLSCPAQCELRIVGVHHATRFPIGDALGVRFATDDEAAFDGEITALRHVFSADGLPEVRVRAYDRLHRLRKRQTVRAFTDTDLVAVAGELVADLGLAVDAEAAVPPWAQLVQHRQSDLELLDEVAQRAGLWFVLRGDRVRLVTLAGVDDPITLTYGVELVEAAIEQNSDAACRSVTALGWDADGAAPVRGEQTEPSVAFTPADATAPARWDVPGSRVLAQAVGAGVDSLNALARAELDVRAARELTVVGTATGDARLRAGGRVAIEGLGRAVAGRAGGPESTNRPSDDQVEALRGPHLLAEVVHTLDELGHLTWFSSRPPDLRPIDGATTVTIATVTDVDDPDGHGRVKATFGGFDDLGSVWLPVVAPAAGAGKGLVALPDVDDVVVVLLPHGNPGEGLVLGGLFGHRGPFDPGVASGEVQRFSFATPGGQSVVLDDEHGRLRLRDRTGNLVELGTDTMKLHAAVDLVIEAPGRNLTVRAKRVDFEEAAGTEDAPAGSGATEGGGS